MRNSSGGTRLFGDDDFQHLLLVVVAGVAAQVGIGDSRDADRDLGVGGGWERAIDGEGGGGGGLVFVVIGEFLVVEEVLVFIEVVRSDGVISETPQIRSSFGGEKFELKIIRIDETSMQKGLRRWLSRVQLKNPCLGTWPRSHTKQACITRLRAVVGVCLPRREWPGALGTRRNLVHLGCGRFSLPEIGVSGVRGSPRAWPNCHWKLVALLLAEGDDGILGTFGWDFFF
ncbi:ATP-dependent helicase family protein [Striga asiatica]|uniref:ATP-dependent helicase family protein n=1 Tax=Striga asiatica TaxID=4170 RepID=A0A5A7R4G9_STRAF|nr:ATP-dependent helicase family protein [Striga asiatica]